MSEQRTFFGHLRTFMIVTLITVMVWLLAESRMVLTRTLEAQVVFTSVPPASGSSADDEGGLVVRQALSPAERALGVESAIRSARIQVEGSTSGIDQFVRLLQGRIELRIGREIPAESGIHMLDLREVLRQSSELAVHGLTITQVSPATVMVEVDRLETREFRIGVDMPAGVELDGVPRTDPPMVRVVAPSSVLAQVKTTQASVQIDSVKVAQLAQGRLETIPGVAIELPGIDRQGWHTQIEPAQVDVFLTLRTLTEQMTIDRLPVQVLMAPGEIGDWRVEISDADKDLVNIVIAGPAQEIEQLRSGEIVPRAFVSLTFEDLERRISSKPTQILGLPPGCRVVSPESVVNLTISPIRAPETDQSNPG
jgi:hypothetical protein